MTIIYYLKLTKKLILTLCLCLLLTSCLVDSASLISEGNINPGISKKQLRATLGAAKLKDDPFWGNCYRKYYSEINVEVLSSASRSVYYVFENVSQPSVECRRQASLIGDGRLASLKYNLKDVENFINTKFPQSIVKKEPKENDNSNTIQASSGSGFFISKDGLIITNNHVVDKCNSISISWKGVMEKATIISTDKKNDLAILKSEIAPKNVFSISNKDVSLLQDIIVAGYPLGKSVSSSIKIHKGSVTSLAGFGDNYSNFQTDATINKGNSGGPVIDQKGNIVGVAVALLSADAAQNVFFAIKSSTLKTFIDSNGVNSLPHSDQKMNNQQVGQLVKNSTVYIECS